MKKIEYSETSEFQKDMDRLCKRFGTLPDDLITAKKNAIELLHVTNLDNRSIFSIPGFCYDRVIIYKLKKFTCRSLKGTGKNSGIRVVYAFFPRTFTVEFIEIYYKADQINEDRDRIKAYLKDKLKNEASDE